MNANIQGYALKQVEFWTFMSGKMNAGIDLMLLYVLESHGSSPGRRGFRMAVSGDRDFCGSIGGGIMEHKFVEMALDMLRERAEGAVYQQVHDKSVSRNQSGMICSGEQTIFLYPLRESDRQVVHAVIDSWINEKAGTLTITPSGLSFSGQPPLVDLQYRAEDGGGFIMEERTGFKNELYIIGGGHCSKALSELMSAMDFHITVIDEREGLTTMRDNKHAHRKLTVPAYRLLADHVSPGDRSYVVVMTFGYRTDDVAFRALMGRPYKYLGILGSRKKIEKMMQDYRSEGLEENMLQQAYAPIGIQIKSETPEEIAVSIAAQIIAVKNKS